MSRTLSTILSSLGILFVLVSGHGSAQSQPDLSGDWVLTRATVSGGRSTGEPVASQPVKETPTSNNTFSGAAFNCGRQCTIVHKGQTLTVENALLASNTKAAPPVTLRLDGRARSVLDSFSPGREIPVTAKWNRDKLEIISSSGPVSVSESIRIDGGQLVVVILADRQPAQPVTLRYSKK